MKKFLACDTFITSFNKELLALNLSTVTSEKGALMSNSGCMKLCIKLRVMFDSITVFKDEGGSVTDIMDVLPIEQS